MDGQGFGRLQEGQKAPGFFLRGVDGALHATSDWAGAVALLVVFTAPSCAQARAGEALLVRLQDKWGARGLQVVALCPNDVTRFPGDGLEGMARHAREHGFNFPFLRDETQEAARAYGARALPDAFLFDRRRLLRYSGAVAAPFLPAAVEAVLEDRVPAASFAPPQGCPVAWARVPGEDGAVPAGAGEGET